MAAVEICPGWKLRCETITARNSAAATALLAMANRPEYRRKLPSRVTIISEGKMFSVQRGDSPESSKRPSTA